RVTGSLAEGEYFFKRKIGDDGAHKTELHDRRLYCDGGFAYTIQKSFRTMKIPGIAPAVSLSLVFLALLVPGPYGRAEVSEQMTPLLLAVQDAPVPFTGSDGRVHLVYELEMTNFSSAEIRVEKVEVLGDGVSLETLDTTAVAERL